MKDKLSMYVKINDKEDNIYEHEYCGRARKYKNCKIHSDLGVSDLTLILKSRRKQVSSLLESHPYW